MDIRTAFNVVLELAHGNRLDLDHHLVANDPGLRREAKSQEEALEIVEAQIEAMDRAGMLDE